jgi:polysaccharide export outer membrane protein
MTLLDALARAQGVSPEAGPEVIVSRTDSTPPGNGVIHISLKALLSGSDRSLNLPLHGGDEIRVPEAPKLYVVGNVKTPGTYPLTDLEGSSVLKVLAQSQGVLPFTAKEAYVYRSVPGSKNREEIAIALNKILHRKTPDFPLQANDILYIPDNTKMRISAGVLEHMAGFGSSTASGLIVWH